MNELDTKLQVMDVKLDGLKEDLVELKSDIKCLPCSAQIQKINNNHEEISVLKGKLKTLFITMGIFLTAGGGGALAKISGLF